MPFGDVLLKAGRITITSADNKSATINKNLLERIALRIFGIPHLSMRLRAHYILSFLNPRKEDKIIDLGCGIGLYVLTLTKRGYDVIGVDLDKNKIEKARLVSKKTGINATFFVGDITKIPFKEKTFDKIIFSDVLEHMVNDKIALKEVVRILKPGGTLILSVPCKNILTKKVMTEMDHCRAGYSLEEIKNLTKKEGLIIKRHKYYCNLLGNLFWQFIRKCYNNKAITILLFYPFYTISLLEGLLNIKGYPVAQVMELKKVI